MICSIDHPSVEDAYDTKPSDALSKRNATAGRPSASSDRDGLVPRPMLVAVQPSAIVRGDAGEVVVAAVVELGEEVVEGAAVVVAAAVAGAVDGPFDELPPHALATRANNATSERVLRTFRQPVALGGNSLLATASLPTGTGKKLIGAFVSGYQPVTSASNKQGRAPALQFWEALHGRILA